MNKEFCPVLIDSLFLLGLRLTTAVEDYFSNYTGYTELLLRSVEKPRFEFDLNPTVY
jgi:hypothetical protein